MRNCDQVPTVQREACNRIFLYLQAFVMKQSTFHSVSEPRKTHMRQKIDPPMSVCQEISTKLQTCTPILLVMVSRALEAWTNMGDVNKIPPSSSPVLFDAC